ncbi:hypothetical protein HDU98_003462, partial [Podochytrium sp. JEL0797]
PTTVWPKVATVAVSQKYWAGNYSATYKAPICFQQLWIRNKFNPAQHITAYVVDFCPTSGCTWGADELPYNVDMYGGISWSNLGFTPTNSKMEVEIVWPDWLRPNYTLPAPTPTTTFTVATVDIAPTIFATGGPVITVGPSIPVGTTCFAAYVPTLGYNAASQVSYQGINYINTWYEGAGYAPGPNSDPTDGGWVAQSSCPTSGTPPPSPSAPTPTPTPAKSTTAVSPALTSTTTPVVVATTTLAPTTAAVVPSTTATTTLTKAKTSATTSTTVAAITTKATTTTTTPVAPVITSSAVASAISNGAVCTVFGAYQCSNLCVCNYAANGLVWQCNGVSGITSPASAGTTATTPPSPLATLLFVAPSAPHAQLLLHQLKSALKTHASTTCPSIGAIVSSIDANKSMVALAHLHSHTPGSVTANAFHLDKRYSEDSPFRRDKPVGRWFEPRDLTDKLSTQHFNLNEFKSISRNTPSLHQSHLRDQINLREVVLGTPIRDETAGVSPNLIITLSDRDPHTIWTALSETFPTTPKMGLVSPMTPFITGLTHTLFMNGQVMDAGGLVGLCISSSTSAQPTPRPNPTYAYTHMTPVGEFLSITACQGNIIVSLDSQQATAQILASLSQQFSNADAGSLESRISSDHALYLEIQHVENAISGESNNCVYKIVAGDLRKGNIAVDTVMDLKVGMKVRFLYQDKEGPVALAVSERVSESNAVGVLRFVTEREDESFEDVLETGGSKEEEESSPVVVRNGVTIGSDVGIIHAVKAGESGFEVTKVPFSTVSLAL